MCHGSDNLKCNCNIFALYTDASFRPDALEMQKQKQSSFWIYTGSVERYAYISLLAQNDKTSSMVGNWYFCCDGSK